MVERIPREERVLTGADFNGHVDEGNRADEEVMGRLWCQGKEPGRTDGGGFYQ